MTKVLLGSWEGTGMYSIREPRALISAHTEHQVVISNLIQAIFLTQLATLVAIIILGYLNPKLATSPVGAVVYIHLLSNYAGVFNSY